jgi:hypothetical protein
MMKSSALFATLLSFTVACGGAPPPAPKAPDTVGAPPVAGDTPPGTPPPTPPGPPQNPFAIAGTVREEPLTQIAYEPVSTPLAAAPKGLVAPPASCGAYRGRRKAGKLKCDDALVGLSVALGEVDRAARDALFVDLEACKELPAGVVRALRIENAEPACGDVLAAPLLGKAGPTPEVQHALFGLALAARLSRTVADAPKATPPFDKAHVLAFIKGPLGAWIATQAKLVEDLSTQASQLRGYGRAVAAVEAGLADLRFVDVVRAVPVPDAIAKDAELKGVYEAALDQMLEPRKERGRDAVLVGLKDLAALGVVKDRRVSSAREVLGKLYAGRRIDALDALLLPPLPTSGATDPPHVLAGRLPSFYAGILLDPKIVGDKDGLAALATSGLPLPVRVRLKAEAPPADVATLLSRARLDLGRAFWRAVDFDEAAVAARAAGGDKGASREAELYLALALALRGGPDDAAQMMRRPTPEGLGIGDVTALDAVAQGGGPYAAYAAFDAAWIQRVSAPRASGRAHWQDVAARFRKAEGLLTAPADKARAGDAAREAEAIAAEAK